MKRHAPAAERNREPILSVLETLLPRGARVLEVGSGSGQHAAFFAERLPGVMWQPTDADPGALASIAAYRDEARAPGLLAPIRLDASRDPAPPGAWDAVFSANVIHISPWSVCEGVVRLAAAALGPGGRLVFYGPFRFSGVFTAPSNEAFDARLRGEHAAWGVRDLDDVSALGRLHAFEGPHVHEMPANNHVVIFVKG
jgi:SAM-dependent methyltransferase